MHGEIEAFFSGFGISLRIVADAFAPPEAVGMVEHGIGICMVGPFGRTEDAAHLSIRLEEGEEDRNPLDNRSLDLGAKELPVFPVPVMDAPPYILRLWITEFPAI
jgi:hypothetical protein